MERVGEQAGNGRRDDDAGGDECGAEHLHRGEDCDGQDEHQHRVDACRAESGRLGDLGVERREQQRPVGEEHDTGDEEGNDKDRHDVGVADAEDAPEQGGVEAVATPAEDREQREAEGERGRGDHADGGVGTDRPTPCDPTDQQGRGDAPHTGAEHDVDAEQGAGGEPAEDGVGEAMTDVAHSLEHHEHTDEAAQRPGDRGNDDAVAEELEFVGLEEVGHFRR